MSEPTNNRVSIDTEQFEESRSCERRQFLACCSRLLAAGLIAPALAACEISLVRSTGPSKLVVDVSTLTSDGASLVTPTNGPDGAPVLVVRRSATEYAALSMLCTHLGCTVGAPSAGVMTCPCHSSKYDLTGAVLAGPAPRSLATYSAQFNPNDGTVTVQFA